MNVSEGVARLVGSVWLRYAGALCLVIIAVLSLRPGHWQARTGLPGPLEHFIAYGITAAVITMGARSRRFPGTIIVTLMLFAGLLEVLQYWAPGRDPELIGFGGSSIGAATGALMALVARKRLETV